MLCSRAPKIIAGNYCDISLIKQCIRKIYGIFDIFGYGVFVDGDPLDGATLTGTLADGTAFDNNVYISLSGTVTLAAPATTAVPEPSSIAMFGIGALGLFGYSRRRRQTSAAA